MNEIIKFDVVWLALTYDCNNKCIWCYADSNSSNNEGKKLQANREDLIASLLNDIGIKRVVLIGGEPTLYSGIERIIEKLSRKKLLIHLVTNGRKFKNKDFVRRLKEKGLTNAGFSIEGSCSEKHDSITQMRGSFDECLQGLQNSCDTGIKTYSNTTISKNNLNDLENIVDLVSQYSVKAINFNICGPCISKEHDHVINPTVAIRAFEKVYKHLKKKKIKSKLLTAMPLCNFDLSMREELTTNHVVHGRPCQLAHGKNFVIDYNGDIIPCTHLTGYPMFNIFKHNGYSISKDDFIDRYNDPTKTSHQFRKGMSKYASTKCERDKCSENCAGGCPLFWTKFDPEKEVAGIA